MLLPQKVRWLRALLVLLLVTFLTSGFRAVPDSPGGALLCAVGAGMAGWPLWSKKPSRELGQRATVPMRRLSAQAAARAGRAMTAAADAQSRAVEKVFATMAASVLMASISATARASAAVRARRSSASSLPSTRHWICCSSW
ncbi:hypothetical protein [Streptomyces sp. NPDC051546]|uniref:hypothetical protein n=1 Tax=Streptomyces sp. NPDC051546 TaxID=3365655 RepID=UPI0037BC7495